MVVIRTGAILKGFQKVEETEMRLLLSRYKYKRVPRHDEGRFQYFAENGMLLAYREEPYKGIEAKFYVRTELLNNKKGEIDMLKGFKEVTEEEMVAFLKGKEHTRRPTPYNRVNYVAEGGIILAYQNEAIYGYPDKFYIRQYH